MSWTCPYCNQPQVLSSSNYHSLDDALLIGENILRRLGVTVTAIACLSPSCKQVTFSVRLRRRNSQDNHHVWYVARNNREKVFANLKAVADQKKIERKMLTEEKTKALPAPGGK